MDPRPFYLQLADLLRERIRAGHFPPGTSLPTQESLMDEHGVSTSVIRQAIDVLRGEGLVESFRGKGVLVRDPPPRRRVSSSRYANQLRALAAGETGPVDSAFAVDHDVTLGDTSIDCNFQIRPAPADIASDLGIQEHQPAFRRDMVWRIDGLAQRISRSWFPLDLVEGTPMTDPDRQPWPGGVIAELAALGLTPTTFDEDVIARMPLPDEAYTLRVRGGVPVLVVYRVGRTRDRVVEVAEIVLPSDKWGLHYRLDL